MSNVIPFTTMPAPPLERARITLHNKYPGRALIIAALEEGGIVNLAFLLPLLTEQMTELHNRHRYHHKRVAVVLLSRKPLTFTPGASELLGMFAGWEVIHGDRLHELEQGIGGRLL